MTTGSDGPSPVRRWLIDPLRKFWHELTSMRMALALLFLLAVAAIPGALLPQRDLNESKTLKYISDHGTMGEWMDRLGFFDVFSSPWFTAIYLLLFISLVGCLTPRMWEYIQQMRAKPVPAPRNLGRMPRHITETVDGSPTELAERVSGNLRGWRRTTRVVEPSDRYPNGAVEVSAEKGYLREFGNLLFHFGLLALLLTIGIGKVFGYEGSRTLVAGEDQVLCNTSTAVYDTFRSGAMVDGTDLNEFCVVLDEFDAEFLPNGQPAEYTAKVRYTPEVSAPQSDWDSTTIRVNEPLRINGDRVYILGNGFAPTFTVTFTNGEQRSQTAPYIPQDLGTMLSEGAMRFDTPAGMYPNEDERRKHQIAIDGLFAPDPIFYAENPHSASAEILDSKSPVVSQPAVAIRVYEGDTGLDTGRSQNVYELDRDLIDQKRLVRKASVNLAEGESTTLPDGTVVTFSGWKRWASVQVSHDPAQMYILISAVAMVVGLLISLLIRRRRIWVRLVTSDDEAGRTLVDVAGLARTDQAGWGDGFDEQARALLTTDGRTGRL